MRNMTTKILLILSVLILIILILVWLFPGLRTFFLIARVSPYEQTLSGAPTILILGDSTGYGTGATTKKESIAGLIGADFPHYNVVNNSVNGRTIGDLQVVVKNLNGEYALILLQIGGNDILQKRDKDQVEQELREIISKLQKHTEHIVMISSGNVGAATRFSNEQRKEYEAVTREFRNMFIAVAEETPITYVDLFVEPEKDKFIQKPDVYLSSDGLHPSSAGYALWYESLRPVLESRLEKK